LLNGLENGFVVRYLEVKRVDADGYCDGHTLLQKAPVNGEEGWRECALRLGGQNSVVP